MWEFLYPVTGQAPLRRRTQTDSPTAQRSANRSSPSSAWIRSFRLFLVAALFNTALNKGGERGLHEPAPSSPASGLGCLSADHATICPGPCGPLSVFRAQRTRNFEGVPLSLFSMMTSVGKAWLPGRPGDVCKQGQDCSPLPSSPLWGQRERQVCRGASADEHRATGVETGRPSCHWDCASSQASDHGHTGPRACPRGPRLC